MVKKKLLSKIKIGGNLELVKRKMWHIRDAQPLLYVPHWDSTIYPYPDRIRCQMHFA